MYIIIVGGGRVGYFLSKALIDEGHEVLLIEKSATVCEIVNDELGSICYRGDGCEAATLEKVGTARADIFIAVTGDDEDNLISCQVAKYKFNVKRTISRIRNPKNEKLFKKLGVDVTISSTNVILEQIAEEVPTHAVIHLHEIRDKGLSMLDIRIPTDGPTIGKAIKDIQLPEGTLIPLIIRKSERPIVPNPNTTLLADDKVIVVTEPATEDELRHALRGM